MNLSVRVDMPRLTSMMTRLGNLDEPMREIGNEIRAEIVNAILHGGSKWAKWRPFKPGTYFTRMMKGKSFVPFSGFIGLIKILPRKKYVRVLIDHKAAKFHHEGRRGFWTIPRRIGLITFPSLKYGRFINAKVRHPGYPKRVLIPPQNVVRDIAARIVHRHLTVEFPARSEAAMEGIFNLFGQEVR